jgi:hypothetical protein
MIVSAKSYMQTDMPRKVTKSIAYMTIRVPDVDPVT